MTSRELKSWSEIAFSVWFERVYKYRPWNHGLKSPFLKANSKFGTSRCLQQTFPLWLKLRERKRKEKKGKRKKKTFSLGCLDIGRKGSEIWWIFLFDLQKGEKKNFVYFTFMPLKKVNIWHTFNSWEGILVIFRYKNKKSCHVHLSSFPQNAGSRWTDFTPSQPLFSSSSNQTKKI